MSAESDHVEIPPWGADRPLTSSIVSSAIRECFPQIDAAGVRHIGSGWEFDAWSTRDGWVFRFPRRAEVAMLFGKERSVHDLVTRALPARIRIPRVELRGQPTAEFPYPFAGHRLIEGLPSDAVDEAVHLTLARDIGVALGAIHSIAEHDARAAGVTEMDAEEVGRTAWIEAGLRGASLLAGLDPVVDVAVRWLECADLTLRPFEGALRFTHNDLAPEHLLVHPATGTLSGILDWTDAILGDAAADFVVLITAHGREFAGAALRSYPHGVDEAFRQRLDFMARVLSVMWLAEAHERRSDVAKHVRWVRNAFAPRDGR